MTEMLPDRTAAAPARERQTPVVARSASTTWTSRTRCAGRTGWRCAHVSFQIGRNESYGLVGESGSGKSTVALALTRYLPRNGRVSAGSVSINGEDPLTMSQAALRHAARPDRVDGLPGAR